MSVRASKPDLRWPLLFRALLAGTALGIVALASGGLFLFSSDGLLTASTGFVSALILALAAGLWAGVPTDEGASASLRSRWMAAGIAMAAAGALATWSLYEGVRSGVVWRVLNLIILAAAPAYVLGLLLSGLLAWAEDKEDEEFLAGGAEEAEGGGWEPLGTLVIGALAGVALGLLLAGLLLVPLAGSGPVLLGTAAALLVPTLFSELPAAEFRDRLLYEAESPLSTIRVVELVHPGRGQPERRLYVNDEEESGELARSGAPTLAYIAAAERWLAAASDRGDDYLVLGGGAYTLPHRIAERDPSARVTVVELDPEVTRVAYRFFAVRPEHGIVSVHGDARAFLDAAGAVDDRRFDRIFVDVYNGQEALPYTLTTLESFDATRRRLTAGGTVLFNMIGVVTGRGSQRFWSVIRTACEMFPAVALYTHLGRDYPERQNVLVAASPRTGATFPERAGLFDSWPREQWPDWEGARVLRDVILPEHEEAPRGSRAAGAS